MAGNEDTDQYTRTAERFRLAAEVTSDLIYEWIIDKGVIDWYGDIDEALGLPGGTLPHTVEAWLERIHPDDRTGLAEAVEYHGTNLEPLRYEYRIRHEDGSWRIWQDRGITVADAEGRPERVVGVCTDITERREAEEALRQSEERFRSLATEINDGLFITDEKGRHLFINRALARIYGYDDPAELMERSFIDMLVPEQRDRMRQAFAASIRAGHYPEQVEVQAVRRDGTILDLIVRPVPYLENGRIAGSRGVVTDVTEQRRAVREREKLQEQLRQSQKLEAVGRLAGGVAHDFNNLLTAIQGYAEFIRDSLPPEDPMVSDVDEIRSASRKAAALTQQLLAFSRKQVASPRIINLNAVLEGSKRMLERIIGEDVALEYDLDPHLPNIHTDPHQMDQIIVNLVVNAREAMPNGGKLAVATCTIPDPAVLPEGSVERVDEPHVCISVCDTGTGMDDETLAKIFEPFYTTKAVGAGSGLGLSTVYGIVKQNRGGIHMDSEPGRGTTFRIFLPATDEPAPEAEKRRVETTIGSATVLVVEDEDVVRKLTRRILSRQGYQVIEAATADEALLLIREGGVKIDLVLTDVIMPMMNGVELSEKLRTHDPDMRVLFMSGYTRDVISRTGITDEDIPLIDKPFQPDDLLRAVRLALEEAPTG